MSSNYYAHSEIGPRVENQDSVQVVLKDNIIIACIADGVGGANCGSVASQESIKAFIQKVSINQLDLETTISEVHNTIINLQHTRPECKGMASTFTGCIIKDYKLYGCQVGDTRLCVLRGNGIKQLTELHTEANRLFHSGQLSKENYIIYPRKNIIESAIGMKSKPKVQTFNFDLSPGDRLLLTSDGVHDLITKVEFRDISLLSSSAEEFGTNIKRLLKTKQLQDNASFIVVSIR